MRANQHFTYTNKAGVTKRFITVYDTPKKEDEKAILMKVFYANDPEPRQRVTRRFIKKEIQWED